MDQLPFAPLPAEQLGYAQVEWNGIRIHAITPPQEAAFRVVCYIPAPEARMQTNLFDLSKRVAIVTGSARGLGQKLAEGLAEQRIKTRTPMGRRARLSELVGPVVFLASDAASYRHCVGRRRWIHRRVVSTKCQAKTPASPRP